MITVQVKHMHIRPTMEGGLEAHIIPHDCPLGEGRRCVDIKEGICGWLIEADLPGCGSISCSAETREWAVIHSPSGEQVGENTFTKEEKAYMWLLGRIIEGDIFTTNLNKYAVEEIDTSL